MNSLDLQVQDARSKACREDVTREIFKYYTVYLKKNNIEVVKNFVKIKK